MSFNPHASPFSSSPIPGRNQTHCTPQRHYTSRGGYMKPQAKWQLQTSPSSSNRRNVCDPLAEGRRVRVDNVFYGTGFVPDFIGAIGIPKSDIERIHSTGPSGGPGMCWVDFVSHAAASKAVYMLRAELRKWLPQVFLCSPATDLSGRTTSTSWRSSDEDHILTEDFVIDQEWPANNLGCTSPTSVGPHSWPSYPREDLLSIKNGSFPDNTSTSSIGHVTGNCSTRPTSDRASITTENTFESSAAFTSASLDKDAPAKSKCKHTAALGSDFVKTNIEADGCLQNGDLRDGEPKEIKPQDIKSWTQSIVTTGQPPEPTPKQSATYVNVSTPKPKTWATIASPGPQRPRSASDQEATKVPAKYSGLGKGAAPPGPGPSWADITKERPASTVKAISSIPDKKHPSRLPHEKEENSSSMSAEKPLLPSSKPTPHRTLFVTGLDPTEDQEYHREEILKIFAGFKVHGISNRKKIDRVSNHANCFIDMETAEDAHRAIETWPWPTDRIGGGLIKIAWAKSESNRPLDYTVVRESRERQSRRNREKKCPPVNCTITNSMSPRDFHSTHISEIGNRLPLALFPIWVFTTTLNKVYESVRDVVQLVFFHPPPQRFLHLFERLNIDSLLQPQRSEPFGHASFDVRLAEYNVPVIPACALEGVV
ncbi:hypothetical protein PspLS_10569 [Pyricularia sp. CBS 133598]|nr:hypothetical protein PspLS_12079 [Pyricularia sp. CBS 133598]TLD17986.1 hypothetical protein PspLS_10569 [Pyricularia sp. CBS 133598]